MKLFLTLCVIATVATLGSVSAHAGRFTCVDGITTPKFENDKAVFHIEPFLWDNAGTRDEITRAFETWNNATGYKMNFQYVRGFGTSYSGDGIHQVRRQWTYQNPNDESDHATAQNIALPFADPGQCEWYESDIVLNLRYFREGAYEPSEYWNLYSVMLHEIGHAIGMPHANALSVLNLAWWDTTGLFERDIQFARSLYGMHSVNIPRNFRADSLMLVDGRLRNEYNIDYGKWVPDSIIGAPYTITNTGTYGELLDVEILIADSPEDLKSGIGRVVSRFPIYIDAGHTVSGFEDVTLNYGTINDIFSGITTLGFRVLSYDTNPHDDAVATN